MNKSSLSSMSTFSGYFCLSFIQMTYFNQYSTVRNQTLSCASDRTPQWRYGRKAYISGLADVADFLVVRNGNPKPW